MDSKIATIMELAAKAKDISQKARIDILRMTHKTGASHVGSGLSVIDILATTFVHKYYKLETYQTEILLSKGHAAAALYAVLHELNLLNGIPLDQYCEDDSKIYGHVNHLASPEIPLSTGSLGHGMPFALGMALASRLKESPGRTFVILSDGECNEGTTWESALVANQFKLNNLVVIIDRNRIQSLGMTEETISLEPLEEKWISFGWKTVVIDGHDHSAILEALETETTAPLCIIAETIKGKGVTFMENSVLWHYKSPSSEELTDAIEQVRKDSK
jgi:transketolase